VNGTFTERGQKTLKVNIPYRGSQGPLHLLIPSRALLRNTLPGSGQHRDQGRGRRRVERPQAQRHETARLAQDPHPLPGRRMAHSPRGGIDEQTLEIRAAEFTTRDVGDAPMLPELLNQIPPDQEIASVTAPSHGLQANRCPLSGRACVHAREGGNGRRFRHPQVPRGHRCPRRCRHHSAPQERQAMEARHPRGDRAQRGPVRITTLRSDHLATPLGSILGMRLPGNGWSGYHRRSRVETKMHCLKLLGQRLAARDFDRQVAEFQIRVAVLNGFTALGIPVTEAAG
jgi:hypothetical protein